MCTRHRTGRWRPCGTCPWTWRRGSFAASWAPPAAAALTDGKLFGTERELDGLLDKLAALAAEKGAEFITVFYGDGISEADAQHAEQRFIDACPEAEVSLLPGGQPVYYYIISIE